MSGDANTQGSGDAKAMATEEPRTESPAEVQEAQAQEAQAQETKTSLADRIGMIVGGQFVTTIIGLLQGILVVRLLPKSSYGSLAFVMMLYTTARDLALFYIPESLLYFANQISRAELKGLVRQSMALLLGLGALVALLLAALALSPGLFLDGRDDLTALLLLAGVTAMLGLPGSVFGNVFIATNRHRASAGISLVVTLVGTVTTLVPAVLGWHVAWILVGQNATTALRLALSYRVYQGLFPGVKTAPFPGGVRAQMRYVTPLAVGRFAGLFNQKLDKFVVGLFFSAAAFAEFAIGSQELPLVSILPYTVASSMLPQFVERFQAGPSREAGARDAIALWHAGIRKTTLVMLPVAVFLLLGAEALMVLLYGEAYRGAALPFRIYGALLPLRVTAFGIMMMAFGETKMILRTQIQGMVFNVVAALILLPTVGMMGAPLAAVLTQVMMIVYYCYRIERVGRVGLSGIFPWGHYGRTALAALVAGVPVMVAMMTLGARLHPALLLGAGLPIYAALYLLAARVAGVIAPEDQAFVARWLRLEPLRKKTG
ncbi:oligosaccharide flippase family protein [Chondromyces crocatus]|uniref:Oligosaccharyl transferase n=1 Tax=Chondromyces crocatus TaxID=52 RepID=A0A0K1ELC6_CHOCO|nr:oligosaccharide flippase family protein [Chondromyces crocatus]AKT41684.1 oligosaccharyl transferase [Chondromyces crocatus]